MVIFTWNMYNHFFEKGCIRWNNLAPARSLLAVWVNKAATAKKIHLQDPLSQKISILKCQFVIFFLILFSLWKVFYHGIPLAYSFFIRKWYICLMVVQKISISLSLRYYSIIIHNQSIIALCKQLAALFLSSVLS